MNGYKKYEQGKHVVVWAKVYNSAHCKRLPTWVGSTVSFIGTSTDLELNVNQL